ncbi:MAG TPA: hypothetical protein VK335_01995 [Bryobacteraceae bacterium]|nr:hypothetical protein [Bryobacteraceae bacterium]
MSAQDERGNTERREDQPLDFDKAIADIRRAAEVLAQPEAKQAIQAIQDAVKAVTAVQDAVKAVALTDAAKAVAIQDAMKAVAVSDAVKAVAVQDAVKAVAVVVAEAQQTFRTAISQEIERAVQMIRDAAQKAGKTSKK